VFWGKAREGEATLCERFWCGRTGRRRMEGLLVPVGAVSEPQSVAEGEGLCYKEL
jgi:hypothetical protein